MATKKPATKRATTARGRTTNKPAMSRAATAKRTTRSTAVKKK